MSQDEQFCPYRGLQPYTKEDQAYFFGRELDRKKIAANLATASLTILYGASGVGKTSVLQAGVLPYLEELPDLMAVSFREWRDETFLGSLKAEIVKAVEDRTGAPFSVAEDVSLDDLLQSAANAIHGTVLVLLDQFEEYFLYHPTGEVAQRFDTELSRAINRADVDANFLLGIREDCLSRLADRFQGRIPNLLDNYLRLGHLDRKSARAAIEKPVDTYNKREIPDGPPISIEPALVEAILEEVETTQNLLSEAGAGGGRPALAEARIETPYLQLVMTRLWNTEMGQGSNVLRLRTLEDLGGAKKIVRTHLDTVIDRLSQAEQDIAAKAFFHLVTPSGTKIAHTAADLAKLIRVPESQLAPVLDKLTASDVRILRPVEPPPDRPGASRYEIFHDVLASAILDWRSRYEQQRAQEQAAQEAAERERRAAEDRELAAARNLALVQSKRAEAEKLAASRLRLLVGVLGILTLLLIALAGFAFSERHAAKDSASLAVAAKIDADRQRDTAKSRQFAAQAKTSLDSSPQLALLLAVEALDTQHTFEADDALRKALQASQTRAILRGFGDKVNSMAFTPDGHWVATASGDRYLRVWSMDTASPGTTVQQTEVGVAPRWISSEQRIAEPSQRVFEADLGSEVLAVGFSPDGRLLAAVNGDGTVRKWLIDTLNSDFAVQEPVDFRLEGAVTIALFSPDSRALATGSSDGTARVWSVPEGQKLATLTGHRDGINAISLSPDGSFLATASLDGIARLWDVSSSREITTLVGHAGSVDTLVFSPDSRLLATAGADGTARLWETATGEELRVLQGHMDRVTSVAFSPDSQTLATASADRTAMLWDVATGAQKARLSGHTDRVNAVAFDAKGQRLATVSSDGTTLLWNVATGELETRLRGHTSSVNGVLFHPAGSIVATSSSDKTVRLWDVTESQKEIVVPAQGWGIDVSPDGTWLAAGGKDGDIYLWDLQAVLDPTSQASPVVLPTSMEDSPLGMAEYSPNGKLLVSNHGFERGDPDKPTFGTTLVFWDVSTPLAPRQVVSKTIDGYLVLGLAFSSDGRLLASAETNGDFTSGGIRVWDVSGVLSAGQIEQRSTIQLKQQGAVGVSFAGSNGELLAATGMAESQGITDYEGNVYLWEVSALLRTDNAAPVAAIPSPAGSLFLAVSPKDGLLAIGNSDGTIELWDVEQTRQSGGDRGRIAVLRGHEGFVYNLAFSRDGQMLASGTDDTMVLLWDVATARSSGGRRGKIASLQGYEATVTDVEFSADGSLLVTKGDEGVARVWPVDPATMKAFACRAATRNFTQPEWDASFDPDVVYHRTCDAVPVHNTVVESAIEMARQGEPDEALSTLRHLRDIDPSLNLSPEALVAEALFELASEYVDSERYEEGVELMKRAVEIDPPQEASHRIDLLRAQAQLYIILGEVDKAVATLRQVADLDPSMNLAPEKAVAEALVQRASNVLDKGETDEALAALRKAVELDSSLDLAPGKEVARILVQRGEDLVGRGETAEALVAFRRAVELDPSLDLVPDAEIAKLQGLASAREGQVDEALAALRKAIELDPSLDLTPEKEIARILVQRGENLVSGGETAEALAAFRQAIELDPNLDLVPEAEVALFQARALVEQGQVDEALSGLSQAVDLDPRLEQHHALELAYIYNKICSSSGTSDLADQGIEACRRAVVLASKTDDAYVNYNICRNRTVETPAEVVQPACDRAMQLAQKLSPDDTVQGVVKLAGGDVWAFEGAAGQVVTIQMSGEASGLDSYLTLIGPDGDELITDDDSGGGLDSKIAGFILPATGSYMIVATSLGSTGSGAYRLTLTTSAAHSGSF